MPLKAMTRQMIVDFIADHTTVKISQKYVEMKPWKLHFDGSSHKNGNGIGVLLILPDDLPTKLNYRIEGTCSNNEAEYEALIAGLEILLKLGARRVKIRGDSELVIKQITKEYRCIKENLIMYFVIANILITVFDFVDIQHIPRLENQEADDLA